MPSSTNLQLKTLNLDSKSTGSFPRCAAVRYTDPVHSPSSNTMLEIYATNGSQTDAANTNASDACNACQNIRCDVVPQDKKYGYYSYNPYDCRGPEGTIR